MGMKMKGLLWRLVVSGVVWSVCVLVREWMGVVDDWGMFVRVLLGVVLGKGCKGWLEGGSD